MRKYHVGYMEVGLSTDYGERSTFTSEKLKHKKYIDI